MDALLHQPDISAPISDADENVTHTSAADGHRVAWPARRRREQERRDGPGRLSIHAWKITKKAENLFEINSYDLTT